MKTLFFISALFSLSVQASPFLSVKQRLRLHMWVNGLDQEKASPKISRVRPKPLLPEEIERPLRKI